MTSLLRRTRTVTFTRTVSCTLEKAISFLHSPPSLIDMNTRVDHREQSPDDPTLWIIQYHIPVLGFTYRFSYTAKVTQCEDGATFDVDPPMGVQLRTRWTAEEVDSEGKPEVKITEEVKVMVRFLRP